MKIAAIILNRNLPYVTNKLYHSIKKNNKNLIDVFIVDAGSDNKKISKYTTWKANSKSIKKMGLRYGRGMNYGLLQLWKENKFENSNNKYIIICVDEKKKKQSIFGLFIIIVIF